MDLDTSFLNKDIEPLLRKLREHDYNGIVVRNNLILDLIRIKQPVSKYEIHKLSELSYNTIKQVCKWLEASDLIYSKVSVGENGMPVQLVSTKKEEDKNDNYT